jgi:hypothetical protein
VELELASMAVGDSSNAKLSGVRAIADDRNILQMHRQASKQARDIGARLTLVKS